jgi:hypothetical protein
MWYSGGWDPATGGFVEKLDIEGRWIVRRRVRVQARQISCFAKVADLLRNRDEGAGISPRESKKSRSSAGFRSLARSGWIYNERYARYV